MNNGFVNKEETEIPGISAYIMQKATGLIVAEMSEEAGHRFSIREDEYKQGIFQVIQKKTGCHFLLLVWKEQEEDHLCFFSDTRRVRAIEFMDYMISESGLVNGNAAVAVGRISSALLKVKMSGMDIETTLEYYLEQARGYFSQTRSLEAGSFGTDHAEYIRSLPLYEKKKIPWAYVKSTDIAPEGKTFRIRSLENESGITLTADEDIYVMIGCRGEAYDITRDKFESTYEKTSEVLDIFEQMLDFIPEAELSEEGDYVSLDELAHLCYPKGGNAIYAEPLRQRTKIFPENSEEYYLGRPGDYMAVRSEDLTDIYVIQHTIFKQTYEEKH